jgi:DNA (cytosine-5)-methyltransferase 1
MKIADLCCGAGGAAMGLHQAFPDAEIVGIDVRPQPRYPFTFVQGDALEFDLSGFDFVWASPPCQEHSTLRFMSNRNRSGSLPAHHKDILAPMRRKLLAWGGPWIMENVVGAPLRYSAQLCGQAFGLRVYRHRRFEAPFMLMAPPHQSHTLPTGAHRRIGDLSRKQSFMAGIAFASVTGNCGNYCGPEAMGIDWMLGRELSQAVPPVYSRYLAQFIPVQERAAA